MLFRSCEDIFYRPRHPYTWALIRSVPRLDLKNKQDHRVVERRQQVDIAGVIARILRYLRDDELRLGCGTGKLPPVGRRERGDARALGVRSARMLVSFVRGEHVRVPVTVVVGERNLGADPDSRLALTLGVDDIGAAAASDLTGAVTPYLCPSIPLPRARTFR